MIRLAPEGWPFVVTGLILTGLLALGAWVLGRGGPGWGVTSLWAGAGALAVLSLFTLYFFRDPPRTPPEGQGLVLAPADGRIVQITQVDEPTFIEGRATRISIFLSIFNVHLQRAPVSGTVRHKVYKPGGFAVAWAEKASEENEQASLGLDHEGTRVLVRQIAGLVARRVVTDPEVGDSIQQGTRIGLIRFGSRVDLFLPTDWEVTCQKGDRAVGGETILARIPSLGDEASS
jgi:phosphatidylserine decarboxylase